MTPQQVDPDSPRPLNLADLLSELIKGSLSNLSHLDLSGVMALTPAPHLLKLAPVLLSSSLNSVHLSDLGILNDPGAAEQLR